MLKKREEIIRKIKQKRIMQRIIKIPRENVNQKQPKGKRTQKSN